MSAPRSAPVKNAWRRLGLQGLRFCGSCLWSFCVWSLWLALTIALIGQIYIASTRELTLPAFVQRAFEERLAASGLRVEFGSTRFDPSGQVLLENARLFLPASPEPAATARTLHLTFDLWAMLAGRFETGGLSATGVTLNVPPMLSPTGGSEAIVHDLDLAVRIHGRELVIDEISGRLANLQLTAQGAVNLSPLLGPDREKQPLPALLARHYPEFCRQLITAADYLARLAAPSLDLVLTPSETRGATVQARLLATRLEWPDRPALAAGKLALTAAFPLKEARSSLFHLEATADTLQLAEGIQVTSAQGAIRARFNPAENKPALLAAEITLGKLSGQGLDATDVALRITSERWPLLHGELLAAVRGAPLAVEGTTDLAEKSADLHTAGAIAPSLLVWLEQRLGRDLRQFVDFDAAPVFDLTARFAPGWKFTGATGRVAAQGVRAHGVRFDEIEGRIQFDGQQFLVTDARGRSGANVARGDIEQNIRTKEFRFLLRGRLNPPVIGSWFKRPWWNNLWANFDFSAAAPSADVDVHGWWRRGPETTVFVLAEGKSPVIREVALDRGRTRLFIRPHFFDGLEIFAAHGEGRASGTFTRIHADSGPRLNRMDFDFTSTLGAEAAALGGPEIAAITEPFVLTRAPVLEAAGFITGPAATDPDRRSILIRGATSGPLTYHEFPLDHLSFVANVRDDVIDLTPVAIGFGGGIASGRIMVDGPETARRLGFDLSLKDANLRDAAIALEHYSARQKGAAPSPTSSYLEGTARVNVNLNLSADGALNDLYSFTGSGYADLNGPGLGRVRLLGLLSELLYFTALDFDSLQTGFTLDRTKLVFPDLTLTGPNAAVSAHGDYLLPSKELDFYAKIYPFQESKFILKSVVGLVLSPLSSVLEVKLGGKLEKPSWAFVIGPTNLLRSLISAPAEESPEPAATESP